MSRGLLETASSFDRIRQNLGCPSGGLTQWRFPNSRFEKAMSCRFVPLAVLTQPSSRESTKAIPCRFQYEYFQSTVGKSVFATAVLETGGSR